MTEQKWTVETLAAKVRELLADSERLKAEYERVRASRGGPRLATLGRERQVISRHLLAAADAYRVLRGTPEHAALLAACPSPPEGSDFDVLEKLAAQWVPKAEQGPRQPARGRYVPPLIPPTRK